MRVLVTGSEGYIGSVLVPLLRRRGHQVRCLDAGYFADCNLLDGSEPPAFTAGDVRDVQVETFESIDAVIHLAGLSNDLLGDVDPALTYDVNVVGTERVARAARDAGVSRFVFASSCSVYGPGDHDSELTESATRNPLTAYARSKASGEDLLDELATETFRCTSLRAATVFGPSPRIRLDLVLNELTAMAIVNKSVSLNSSGTAWRPFIHIDDLCQAYAATIEAGPSDSCSSVYNVGSAAATLQVVQAAAAISEETGVPLIAKPGAPHDARSYRVNFDRFAATFPGWHPDFDLPHGLAALARFLRAAAISGDTLSSSRFRRLPHLVDLMKDGIVGPDLRRPEAALSTPQNGPAPGD